MKIRINEIPNTEEKNINRTTTYLDDTRIPTEEDKEKLAKPNTKYIYNPNETREIEPDEHAKLTR